MRIFLFALFVLAAFSVVLLLSNTGSADLYSLRLVGWTVVHDTVPTLLVAALFAGAAVAGVPLALANWWLRRRVGQLERHLQAARQQAEALRSAPAAAETEEQVR
jgi:hypothetical protein